MILYKQNYIVCVQWTEEGHQKDTDQKNEPITVQFMDLKYDNYIMYI